MLEWRLCYYADTKTRVNKYKVIEWI